MVLLPPMKQPDKELGPIDERIYIVRRKTLEKATNDYQQDQILIRKQERKDHHLTTTMNDHISFWCRLICSELNAHVYLCWKERSSPRIKQED
ncbi:MAG: hypothetical protein ACI90V_001468 [Bacillariaceae sp.]|jgi:hypothetical protein